MKHLFNTNLVNRLYKRDSLLAFCTYEIMLLLRFQEYPYTVTFKAISFAENGNEKRIRQLKLEGAFCYNIEKEVASWQVKAVFMLFLCKYPPLLRHQDACNRLVSSGRYVYPDEGI